MFELSRLSEYFPHIAILVSMATGVYFAHKNAIHKFNIYDYFLDPVSGLASITRSLQIVAGLTATWIVVEMSVNKTLTIEFFAVYLAALGVSEGWSKFIGARYGNKTKDSSDDK